MACVDLPPFVLLYQHRFLLITLLYSVLFLSSLLAGLMGKSRERVPPLYRAGRVDKGQPPYGRLSRGPGTGRQPLGPEDPAGVAGGRGRLSL